MVSLDGAVLARVAIWSSTVPTVVPSSLPFVSSTSSSPARVPKPSVESMSISSSASAEIVIIYRVSTQVHKQWVKAQLFMTYYLTCRAS